MAKTQAERDAAAAEKRAQAGEEELRFRVRPGVKQMLVDMQGWAEFAHMVELIQTMIRNVHALGPDGARQFLEIPRHNYTYTENVAREFYNEGARKAEALDRSEQ